MVTEFTPRAACPTCRPELDFGRDWTIASSYCNTHRQPMAGSEDMAVATDGSFASYATSEIDPETNRRMCALLHRDRVEPE